MNERTIHTIVREEIREFGFTLSQMKIIHSVVARHEERFHIGTPYGYEGSE